ncbi:hypothetical protein BUE81_27075 [Escherichia coli]|nr:hypothetical protein BUE81_27075 [Escherichia coli]
MKVIWKLQNITQIYAWQLRLYRGSHCIAYDEKVSQLPKLAKALREIGRIEQTLFMLDWFRDSGLRRCVQAVG